MFAPLVRRGAVRRRKRACSATMLASAVRQVRSSFSDAAATLGANIDPGNRTSAAGGRVEVGSHNSKRGSTACANNIRSLMWELDGVVLREIQDKILTSEHIEQVVRAAAKRAAERRRKQPKEEQQLRRDVTDLRAQIQRFIELIGVGRAPEAVLDTIARLEVQLKTKETTLAQLGMPEVSDLDQFSLHGQLRENLERFREVIGDAHEPRARQALRRLLGNETMWFEPVERGYVLTGETRLGPLFQGCGIPSGEMGGAEERT